MVNLSNIKVAYGSRILFKNAGFLIRSGDKIGLVGPNGSGKTTVFRLIASEESPDEGSVTVDPGIVVGYFSQDVGEMSGHSVLNEVFTRAGRVFKASIEMAEMEHLMSDQEAMSAMADDEMEKFMDHYGEIQSEFQNLGGYELEDNAKAILDGLGIPEERQNQRVETFSGGWKMRIALARILVLNPNVLLIDEPTNHLDIASREVLLEALQDFEGTIIIVSHDRYFLRNVVNRVFEIDHGAMRIFEGDYNYYLEKNSL